MNEELSYIPDERNEEIEKTLKQLRQNLLDQEITNVKTMAGLIYKHFTNKTKILPIPRGILTYRIPELEPIDFKNFNPEDPPEQVKVKYESITLQPFFGMYVGYSVKHDILIIWDK